MNIEQEKTKRIALLMGYFGWDRKNSPPIDALKDIDNYEAFLKSNKGGAWESNEIIKLTDKTLYKIREELYKGNFKYDFAFIVYCGHGCFDTDKKCRRFEINKNEKDDVFETDIKNFSQKTIFIYDSCSNKYTVTSEKLISINEYLEERKYPRKRENIRKLYEEWYTSCQEQYLPFYSSQIGQSAHDREDGKGGMYSYELLNVLKNVTHSMDIVKAHQIAKDNLIKRLQYNKSDILQQPCDNIPENITKYLPGAIVIK